MLPDFLTFSLVLAGIERIQFNETVNPFLRMIHDYYPYSHSLFSTVIIAVAVLVVFSKLMSRSWGLGLSIGIISHWFLDVIAHFNVPVFFNNFRVGLGMWQFPWLSFIIEIVLLLLAGYYYLRGLDKIKRPAILIVLLIAGFSYNFFAPATEATAVQASATMLIIYSAFTALAYWSER